MRAGAPSSLRDRTFAGRVGWRAIRAVPGRGTAVRSSVAADDPTRDLTVYPEALLRSPVRRARGHPAGVARRRHGDGAARRHGGGGRRRGARLRGAARRRPACCVLLLLAAFGWGAVHALSPGHGKGMVAAYLVGTRGRARDAVALGGDRHRHAHDRRVRPRPRHARAQRVRAAGGPLPVAQPRLRLHGGRRRARRPALAARRAHRHHHHHDHDHAPSTAAGSSRWA